MIKKSIRELKVEFQERVSEHNLTMTKKEVIDIVQESHLWESLSQNEKQEAISHALKITQPYYEKMDREDYS